MIKNKIIFALAALWSFGMFVATVTGAISKAVTFNDKMSELVFGSGMFVICSLAIALFAIEVKQGGNK